MDFKYPCGPRQLYLSSEVIIEGTRSWDKIMLQVLSLVLMTATAVRAGDIARSDMYKGEEYVYWSDVELKATGLEFKDLRMRLSLCSHQPPIKLPHGLHKPQKSAKDIPSSLISTSPSHSPWMHRV